LSQSKKPHVITSFSFRDNIPVIVLCQWCLEADYLEEEHLSGLLPVLFANDTESAEKGMRDNPTSTMKDIDRLARVFFSPETVGAEAALAVVKKPRAGDADFIFKNRNLDRLFEVPLPKQRGKQSKSV
jgi:hypothetical protein